MDVVDCGEWWDWSLISRRCTREARRMLRDRPTAGDAEERRLIALRYSLDYSHTQIAAELEIPDVTARVRLHRARKRLAALLDERD